MTFPILTEADLPPKNTSCERSDLDFKVKPTTSRLEQAKDVAAMANTLGGSIIVGAATGGMVLSSYLGIPSGDAEKLPDQYEQSVKDRCRPSPRIASAVIKLSDPCKALVVVNVWPSPLAPVGVNINQPVQVEFIDQAWIFPVRVGSQTRWLQPDQFGSLENVSARRAAALLLGIPQDQRKQLRIRGTRPTSKESGAPYSAFEFHAELDGVLPDKNVAQLRIGQEGSALGTLNLPLDWIETVWWEERINKWIVSISAAIDGDPPGTTVAYKAIKVWRQ